MIGGCQLYLKMRQLKVFSNIPVLIAVRELGETQLFERCYIRNQTTSKTSVCCPLWRDRLWVQMTVKFYIKVYFISFIIITFWFVCFSFFTCSFPDLSYYFSLFHKCSNIIRVKINVSILNHKKMARWGIKSLL